MTAFAMWFRGPHARTASRRPAAPRRRWWWRRPPRSPVVQLGGDPLAFIGEEERRLIYVCMGLMLCREWVSAVVSVPDKHTRTHSHTVQCKTPKQCVELSQLRESRVSQHPTSSPGGLAPYERGVGLPPTPVRAARARCLPPPAPVSATRTRTTRRHLTRSAAPRAALRAAV